MPEASLPPITRQSELRALHRGEICGHLAGLGTTQIAELRRVLIACVEQFTDAIGIRSHAGAELRAERFGQVAALLEHRLTLVLESLLGGFEFGKLVVAQAQKLPHACLPARREFRPRGPLRPRAARVGRMLRHERRRRRERGDAD